MNKSDKNDKPIQNKKIKHPYIKKYPFSIMRVGDSFAFPEQDYKRVYNAARKWVKVHKLTARYSIYWMPAENIYRVFRVK